MTGINYSDRVALGSKFDRVRDIASPLDWPDLALAPDGVMRSPLAPRTLYRLIEDVPMPKVLIPEVVAPGTNQLELIVFKGETSDTTLLIDGDDTPHVWGRNVGGINFVGVNIVDISNANAGRGTHLFDLVGGNGPLSLVGMSQSGAIQFKTVGTIVGMGMFLAAQTLDTNNSCGWVVRLDPTDFGQSHFFNDRRFIGNPGLSDNQCAAIALIGAVPSVSISGCGVQLGKPANAFLHIDASTGPGGSVTVSGNNYEASAGGTFFRPDEVEAITAQSDVSVAVTSFADSATSPGVDTTVNFGAIQDIIRGQVIEIDGGTYAGTYAVVRVASDLMSFDITFVFAGASAGTLALVEHTVADCKYVRDETVVISGAPNYNGTFQVVRRTDTTFVLPQAFVIDDATGTATSSGRDQSSPGIRLTGNGAQEDSTVSGEPGWNGNLATTTVQDGAAAGAYVPFSLTGVVLLATAERVTLTNAVTGEMTFNGESSSQLTYTINVEGVKASGGIDNYRINFSINGALPAFGAVGYSRLVLRAAATGVRSLMIRTVKLDPGDTIEPVIIGDGTTTAPVLAEGQILLS